MVVGGKDLRRFSPAGLLPLFNVLLLNGSVAEGITRTL